MATIDFFSAFDLSNIPDIAIPALRVPTGADGTVTAEIPDGLLGAFAPSGLSIDFLILDGSVIRAVARGASGPLVRISDLPPGLTATPATTLGALLQDTLGSDDSVRGTNRADTLYGFGGDDFIEARRGDDILDGGAGDDTLLGGSGRDSLDGGPGRDDIDGGAGTDTLSYASLRAPVTVSLAESGLQNTEGGGFDVIRNVEHLVGSNRDDTLTGNGARNRIEGGAGNDTLDGSGGNDKLLGGTGDDVGLSSPGRVLFNGGGGLDTIVYVGAGDATISLGRSGFQTLGEGHTVKLRGVEGARGGDGDDVLIGNGRANVLHGGAGGDGLTGRGGSDTLIGGFEADTLTGGTGADVFVFGAPPGDGLQSPSQMPDTVRDFRPGTDKIDISDYVSLDGLNNPVAFRGFIDAAGTASDPSLELEDIGAPGVVALLEFGPRDFRLVADGLPGAYRLEIHFTSDVSAMSVDDFIV